METTFGLEREKIRATLDKKPLARAIALAVETLQGAITTDTDDFWVNTELNVNIQGGKALDKHVRVNVYVPRDQDGSGNPCAGRIVVPHVENRMGIRAELEEKALAWAIAWVIQTVVTGVRAEREDFWVNVDVHVHITQGKAKEKKARINVYGDLVDTYDTTIVDTADSNVIPQEVLQAFCQDFGERHED